MKVKARFDFEMMRHIGKGEIVEMDDRQFQQYSFFVEPIVEERAAPFAESKPDKKYKRGRYKMKGLLKVVMIVALVFAPMLSMAGNYTVVLSSYDVTHSSTAFDALYPNIAGGIAIDKIVLCTTNTVTTPILIGIYDTATSTTLATNDFYCILAGTSAVVGSGTQGNMTVIDFPPNNPLVLTDPAFYKADGDTTHIVRMTVQYR